MAHKYTDGRPRRLCADQQRFDPGRARLHPDAHRIAPPKAATVARNSHRSVAANASRRTLGEVMTHRILVVEDNQPNRELLCDWLESEAFEGACARNREKTYTAFEPHVMH